MGGGEVGEGVQVRCEEWGTEGPQGVDEGNRRVGAPLSAWSEGQWSPALRSDDCKEGAPLRFVSGGAWTAPRGYRGGRASGPLGAHG